MVTVKVNWFVCQPPYQYNIYVMYVFMAGSLLQVICIKRNMGQAVINFEHAHFYNPVVYKKCWFIFQFGKAVGWSIWSDQLDWTIIEKRYFKRDQQHQPEGVVETACLFFLDFFSHDPIGFVMFALALQQSTQPFSRIVRQIVCSFAKSRIYFHFISHSVCNRTEFFFGVSTNIGSFFF